MQSAVIIGKFDFHKKEPEGGTQFHMSGFNFARRIV